MQWEARSSYAGRAWMRQGSRASPPEHSAGQEGGHEPSTHPQRGQQADGAGTAVLDEGPGNDLQRLGHGPVRPLLHPSHDLGLLRQDVGHGHLGRTSARYQLGINQDVAADLHGVVEVALHLLQGETRASRLEALKAAGQ